jgi:hypothetical protein
MYGGAGTTTPFGSVTAAAASVAYAKNPKLEQESTAA